MKKGEREGKREKEGNIDKGRGKRERMGRRKKKEEKDKVRRKRMREE